MTDKQLTRLYNNLEALVRESAKLRQQCAEQDDKEEMRYYDGKLRVAFIVRNWVEHLEAGKVPPAYFRG